MSYTQFIPCHTSNLNCQICPDVQKSDCNDNMMKLLYPDTKSNMGPITGNEGYLSFCNYYPSLSVSQ